MRSFHLLCVGFVVLAGSRLLAGESAAAPLPPAPLPGNLHDDARWLGAHSYAALDLKLEWFEEETGWKLLVAVLKGLPEGVDASEQTRRLFNAWLASEPRQEWAVLLAVFDEKTIRLHAGSMAQPHLSDGQGNRIVSGQILPALETGDREAAIEEGVEAIIKVLRAAGTEAAELEMAAERPGATFARPWEVMAIALAVFGLWMLIRLKRLPRA